MTSNSWEYTGDGHSLAYWAGADLIDMEFVQFHPTGMVWPPSVKGILVTEGVRGDGGTLRNSEGERFMFGYVPEFFRSETADTEEEADRWYEDKLNNRRTPDLLPRDEVARAINSEVKAGRGSPHGGVYLDIATRRPADYIRRRLPSMYHQFKQLADVDITAAPMEVGPTCHYMMGGVRVDADTAASTVPGLFAAGECAGGMHGANRLGGNSLSDLLVFGLRAGSGAAEYAKGLSAQPKVETEQADAIAAEVLGHFERDGKENPYALQQDLQDDDAYARRHHPHRIGATGGAGEGPRTEGACDAYRGRREQTIQSRLAPGDGPALADRGIGSDHARGHRAQREPWRPHPRGLSANGYRVGKVQHRRAPGFRWRGSGGEGIAARDARRAGGTSQGTGEGRRIAMTQRTTELPVAPKDAPGEIDVYTMRVFRGNTEGGDFVDYRLAVPEGQVVLDVIHALQATQANDLAVRWNCKAGKCGSCSAEINGKPKLMCMTRMSLFDPERANHRRADQDVPVDQGPRDRCVLQLRSGARDPGVQDRARRKPTAGTG